MDEELETQERSIYRGFLKNRLDEKVKLNREGH